MNTKMLSSGATYTLLLVLFFFQYPTPLVFSMELVSCKWILLSFLLCFLVLFPRASSVETLAGGQKVRGVNLGGWLIVEGWIKPSLFDGIPNGDMLDGTEVQFKSVTAKKYVTTDNEGGRNVTVDGDVPSRWGTFRLWRVSESVFQLRTPGGQLLSYDGEEVSVSAVSATVKSPSSKETFHIERSGSGATSRVHIKLSNGTYLQVSSTNKLRADYKGKPSWDDNAATFEMTVGNGFHGEYQLANGYGQDKGKEVFKTHRSSFITEEDFKYVSSRGINTVTIPVGWWTALDPNPPAPFIGGSLEYLDKAFSWAQSNNMKCIIDLHAAPGSQNTEEHCASRDGFVEWPKQENINKSLDVIDFFASRYAKNPALLGIALLNEPTASKISSEILVSYYRNAYQIVRKYSSTAYVIICPRIGTTEYLLDANPLLELYQNQIGSSNVVVDLHYFNNDLSFSTNMDENIRVVVEDRRDEIQNLNNNNANGPLVFVGEWSNEWNVKNGSLKDYQKFGKAQLEVYGEASFGWSFWTLKNTNKQKWDFKWNIENNYLLYGGNKDDLCTCGFDNLVIQFED